MKKSKHMKEEKKGYKIVSLFIIIAIIVLALILCKNTKLTNYIKNIEDERETESIAEEIENTNTEEENATENKKLVLKSNYEENKEKNITYFFKENILNEIKILEKYTDEETYIKERDKASKRADIEIIKIDNEQLEIHYKKLRFGSDEGLSHEEIYNKYMGIIGAYEIINE